MSPGGAAREAGLSVRTAWNWIQNAKQGRVIQTPGGPVRLHVIDGPVRVSADQLKAVRLLLGAIPRPGRRFGTTRGRSRNASAFFLYKLKKRRERFEASDLQRKARILASLDRIKTAAVVDEIFNYLRALKSRRF